MAEPATARDVLAAYAERINAHHFTLLLNLIAPHAVFWFSDGTHRGHAAAREAFERTWAALPDEHYWLEDVEWTAEGEAAASCIYRFNWRSGERSGAGRGTTVLARMPAGWRIVHEHLSPEP